MSPARSLMLGVVGLAAVLVAWAEGPGVFFVAEWDRAWFYCAPFHPLWAHTFAIVSLSGLAIGGLTSLVGVMLGLAPRWLFRVTLGLVASLTLLAPFVMIWAVDLMGPPTDTYCTPASDPHGSRLHSSMTGEPDSPR